MLPLHYPAYGSPGRSRTYDPMINSHLSPPPTGLLVNGGQSWIWTNVDIKPTDLQSVSFSQLGHLPIFYLLLILVYPLRYLCYPPLDTPIPKGRGFLVRQPLRCLQRIGVLHDFPKCEFPRIPRYIYIVCLTYLGKLGEYILWSEQSESNWHIILGGDMFYHWTMPALDAEERFALSSLAYETSILLLNYSAMVRPLRLEPRTYRV